MAQPQQQHGKGSHFRKETPWTSMLKAHDFGETRGGRGSAVPVPGGDLAPRPSSSPQGEDLKGQGLIEHLDTWLKVHVRHQYIGPSNTTTKVANQPLMNKIEQQQSLGPDQSGNSSCQSQEIFQGGKKAGVGGDQQGTNKFKHARKDSPFEVWAPSSPKKKRKGAPGFETSASTAASRRLPPLVKKEERPTTTTIPPQHPRMNLNPPRTLAPDTSTAAATAAAGLHLSHAGMSRVASGGISQGVMQSLPFIQQEIISSVRPGASAPHQRLHGVSRHAQLQMQHAAAAAGVAPGMIPLQGHPQVAAQTMHQTMQQLSQLQYLIPNSPAAGPTAIFNRAQLAEFAKANALGPHAVGPSTVGGQRFQQSTKRCSCKRTKCLKLYCPCFADGLYCGPQCTCSDCCNDVRYRDLVQEARERTKLKTPDAFEPKIRVSPTKLYQSSHQAGMEYAGAQVHPMYAASVPTLQHQRGCKCVKTNCLKRYCECFAAGVFCGTKCSCQSCKNNEESMLVKQEKSVSGGR